MLAGLECRRGATGRSSGCSNDGIAAAARAPTGRSDAVAALDRAADRREALGVRVEHAPRPVRRGQRAGNEMRDRDRVLPRRAAPPGRERGRRLARRRRRGRRRRVAARDARRDVDVELERRRADLGEPEADLLDEVEREPVAARRLRRPDRSAAPSSSPGRDRALERRAAARPRRSRCRGRRASGRRAARRSRRASATSPSRRSRSRTRASRASRRAARAARSASQRTASGPAGTGCSPTRSMPGVAYCAWISLRFRAAARPRRAARAGRAHAGLVHAPGGPLAARVPRDPQAHTLFEVCREPELCAEVTLQPVRRHDVDAAVMFADIMLPVLGMGVDVELVENVGPVIEQPVRTLADVERLTVPEPEESVPFILEAIAIVRRELAPEQARDRLLRRPVHGRRLPGRGQAEPRLREREAADVREPGRLARADGEARRRVLAATCAARCGRART